jgi:hypothetical protein
VQVKLLQRWMPLMALVLVPACENTEVTSVPLSPQNETEIDICVTACFGGEVALVTEAGGKIGTGTVAVVLFGSDDVNASLIKPGSTKLELYVNGATKPVSYNFGSIVSFVEHYGYYRLNMNLSSMGTDTIGVSPPPPPPVLRSAMLKDVNTDGALDAIFFVPVTELVKGGLVEGDYEIEIVARGSGISGSIGGQGNGAATDSIRVAPPPPPPVGVEIITH